MVGTLVSFAGIAVLVSLTPGPATALVAASETAFWVLKIVGAVVLLYLGVQALRGRKADDSPERTARTAYGTGILTSFANPKLAVFFIALFPQFVPDGSSVLPTTLAMAALLVVVDLVYFSLLALVVARAHHAVVSSKLARRIERLTGAVMIGLGVRVALERR